MTTSLASKSQDDVSASLEKPLDIKPDKDDASYNEGNELFKLGRYEEAIASWDKALEFKPDSYEVWYNRSIALWKLGRYEEAIASYDKALEINSDFSMAWYMRGRVLFYNLERYAEATNSFDKALKIQLNNPAAWAERGLALYYLHQYEEAIASFNKALEFTQNDDKGSVVLLVADIFYNKACCYALQGNVEQALENLQQAINNLQQAINLSPDEYREKARTDSDFDSLREDERFQALIQEESDRDEGETRVLYNVSWEEFENILAEMGDNRSSRVAYDQGTLEITMPSQKHEYYKEIIRDLIKYLAEELDLDCESLGSTTWKRKDLLKGAEPDNCFYIQNEPAIRAVKPNIDLSKDPPPDLILEVDYTSPSLNRLPIYAGLEVPEIWIYNMKVLSIYQLEAGKYKETDASLAFGTFPVKEIPSFIKKNIKASPRELRQSFRTWVKQYLTESLH
jgi:tetratricopeptide (TPR) repeat protein